MRSLHAGNYAFSLIARNASGKTSKRGPSFTIARR